MTSPKKETREPASGSHYFPTLAHLILGQAGRRPDAIALLSEGADPLTYGDLRRQAQATLASLRALGFKRGDRLALATPNGPEMALAVATIPCACACVPINIAYTTDEWRRYLIDLEVSGLIAFVGEAESARNAARDLGLPIADLRPLPRGRSGAFEILGRPAADRDASLEETRTEDIAFVLPTSGTTARPKAVPLSHANICASAGNTGTSLDLKADDRLLHVLPLYHAHGLISGLFSSLAAGASVVCTPAFSAPRFLSWLRQWRPTWYTAVPTIHQAILERLAKSEGVPGDHTLRFIRSASSSLPSRVLSELERRFGVPVIETYGMTEAASQIASNPLPPGVRKAGSVGPAAGPEIAVMGADGALLARGERGELVLRGPNMMRGYGAEADNAAAFREDWFRTGDLGYLDEDGYAFIVGRLKEMINRGGQSIAPREIEEAIGAHPAIKEVVAFAVPDTRLGEDVAIAVVPRAPSSVDPAEIRRFAAARLAPHKVPYHIRITERIPKGPTGKLSRSALAEAFPPAQRPELSSAERREAKPPCSERERAMLALWSDVLALDSLGVDEDFFALGGDSLLATQLLSRIRSTFGGVLTHVDVFEAPTIAGLVARLGQTSLAAEQEASLEPVATARDAPLPLTFAQHRFYFLQRQHPSATAYQVLDALHLEGALDRRALTRTLAALIERHEALRTRFLEEDGVPLQIVDPPFEPDLPLETVDQGPLAECRPEIERRARREFERPFDLERGPVIRARLLRLGPDEHVLLVTTHHIATDGWSQRLFWAEFGPLYAAFAEGRTPSLPTTRLQYGDVAAWQDSSLKAGRLEPEIAYWRQQLDGAATLGLPTDKARPAQRRHRGARLPLAIPAALTERLRRLSVHHGTTLYMTVLAALKVLIHRHTQATDVVIGSLLAGRNRLEIEGIIGFFVNTIALRSDLSGDPTVGELLSRVRHVTLEAYRHQEVPYELVLQSLKLPRQADRNPLFQVLFVWHNTPVELDALPGLEADLLEIDPGVAQFDLTLDLCEGGDGLHGWLEYDGDLFEAATIERLKRQFLALLDSIAEGLDSRISTIAMMSAEERRRALTGLHGAAKPYPLTQTIHGLFERQAAAAPDALALRSDEGDLSFAELNARANKLAHHLQSLGLRPGEIVGLCIERSWRQVAGLLGILKSGAAYLPMDPHYPPDRLAFMLEDAGARLVLTSEAVTAELDFSDRMIVALDRHWPTIGREPTANPSAAVEGQDMAYLIYTSGSTGKPKGATGSHRGVVNMLHWLWDDLPFAAGEIGCQKTSISFADSIEELFAPLLAGRPVVQVSYETVIDPTRFVAALARHRVTRIIVVPSLLRALLDSFEDLEARLPDLKLWLVSGERLSRDLARLFGQRLPGSRLINIYGASETSDILTWEAVRPEESHRDPPIGRAIANTALYVLDAERQPVPPGVVGELYVAGPGVGLGYWRRERETAATFLENPLEPEPRRLFRTGDLVRCLDDGRLECLGRRDDQVQIRGCRVELGEVEAALGAHPDVRQVAVVARGEAGENLRLIAYLLPRSAEAPAADALLAWCRRRLPDFMIPSAFVALDALPLTPSGKLDRRRLPAPAPTPHQAEPKTAPRTPTQEVVIEIWRELLGVEQIAAEDDFFALGGHSLLAGRLLARIDGTLGVALPLRSLFDAPSVAELAEEIDRRRNVPARDALPPIGRTTADIVLPVTPAQANILMLERALPGIPSFNLPYSYRLSGPLDAEALVESFEALIRRHEALRHRFQRHGEREVQTVSAEWAKAVEVEDLSGNGPDLEEAIHTRAKLEAWKAFDLSSAPLLRVRLLRLSAEDHVLLMTFHHAVCDGWSMSVLMRELGQLYESHGTAEGRPLPAPAHQFSDFIAWQAAFRDGKAADALLGTWRDRLLPPPPELDLTAPAEGAGGVSLMAARTPFELDAEISAALIALSRRESCSLFMTLLAAFKLLLRAYSGQGDIAVASMFANRGMKETESIVGLLINTVILRTKLDGAASFRDALRRVHESVLNAHDNQALPFEDLTRRLQQEEKVDARQLGQTIFVLQDALQATLSLAGLEIDGLEADDRMGLPDLTFTDFDLGLVLKHTRTGLRGHCLYKSGLFDDAAIATLIADYRRLLERVVTRPDQSLDEISGSISRRIKQPKIAKPTGKGKA
ncbi:MAG: amino acid adenylation domain-containing protein [Kiloniellales bacterium]|nr:amino acid adenylation domain-containing protein [Kiloniellales bacterium]